MLKQEVAPRLMEASFDRQGYCSKVLDRLEKNMSTELEKLMLDVAMSKKPLSQGLSEARATLQGKILDSDYQWLVSEETGHPMAEGDTAFEHNLPPTLPEYRLVYCDGIGMQEPHGKVHKLKAWPNISGVPVNKIQVVMWPMADIEKKLNTTNDYFHPPATNLELPDIPMEGLTPVLIVHRSQLQRLYESAKQKYLKLVNDRSAGESK
jgi:hypothetical protein